MLAPKPTLPPIYAELKGSDTCSTFSITATGIVASGPSPVLALCRQLIKAGVDHHRPLHAYRGNTLCLVIRSIGEAARLEINAHGSGFIAFRSRRAAPPIDWRDAQAIPPARVRAHE
jgi:hypothetical protein